MISKPWEAVRAKLGRYGEPATSQLAPGDASDALLPDGAGARPPLLVPMDAGTDAKTATKPHHSWNLPVPDALRRPTKLPVSNPHFVQG